MKCLLYNYKLVLNIIERKQWIIRKVIIIIVNMKTISKKYVYEKNILESSIYTSTNKT